LSAVIECDLEHEKYGFEAEHVAKILRLSDTTAKRMLEDAASIPGGLVEREGKDYWRLTEVAWDLLSVLKPFYP
jgi:hypothetical protein